GVCRHAAAAAHRVDLRAPGPHRTYSRTTGAHVRALQHSGVTQLYRLIAELFPPRDRASLLLMVHAAIREGVIERALGDYLQAGLDLPELRLRNAMVPRVDVVAVPDDCSAADAARRMAESGRKRLPVYHGSIDHP